MFDRSVNNQTEPILKFSASIPVHRTATTLTFKRSPDDFESYSGYELKTSMWLQYWLFTVTFASATVNAACSASLRLVCSSPPRLGTALKHFPNIQI